MMKIFVSKIWYETKNDSNIIKHWSVKFQSQAPKVTAVYELQRQIRMHSISDEWTQDWKAC